MQFSETVVAAMIGATATMFTALFQIVTALRSRNKQDVRPKRGGVSMRSVIAIVALMAGSGVGGYLYGELRQEHASEDIRSMRDELNAKLQLLASTTERIAAMRDAPTISSTPVVAAPIVAPVTTSEAVIYAPPCSAGSACTEQNAQHFALCGAIPTVMQVRKVELFAKPATATTAWDQAAANFEQDIGGGKFIGSPAEHAEDDAHKAVCVDFVHWSAEPHLARLVLQYGASVVEPSASDHVLPAVAAAQLSTSQTTISNAHTVSMTSSTAGQ